MLSYLCASILAIFIGQHHVGLKAIITSYEYSQQLKLKWTWSYHFANS